MSEMNVLSKYVDDIQENIKRREKFGKSGGLEICEAKIISVTVDERQNIFETESKYGLPDDLLVKIDFEVYDEDTVIDLGSSIYTLSRHPKSYFYKFVKKYGEPNEGDIITVRYLEDSERWSVII